MKMKHRVFEIVQIAKEGDNKSRIFDISIMTLIIINTISVIVETFTIPSYFQSIFYIIEVGSVIIFTLEYLLRVWTADLLYSQCSAFHARVKYVFSFMAIVDLVSILPFYIPFIIRVDLRVIRILRLLRLLRLFKINRYTSALSSIAAVFKKKANQLISSLFVISLLMVIASVIMYNVENPAQPEVFENAFSGLWWAIATLTTVGYGDIYPITVAGKILSAFIALLGIGLVAVPTGIISAGFMEQIEHRKALQEDESFSKATFCPHCGKRLR